MVNFVILEVIKINLLMCLFLSASKFNLNDVKTLHTIVLWLKCFILDCNLNASEKGSIFSSRLLYIKDVSDSRCVRIKCCCTCIKKYKEQQKLE